MQSFSETRIDVIHLNISDGGGGVGRASYRLHQGLLDLGLNSKMLVDVKTTNDPSVYGPRDFLDRYWSRVRTRLDKLPGIVTKRDHWKYVSFNYLPNPRIIHTIRSLNPRLLHLHWIGDGLLPLHDFKKLQLPVVATLHGRWLFNGAQHLHKDDSMRFIEGFKFDNRDVEDRGFDVDKWVWQRKAKALNTLDLHVLALSRWMEFDAKRSVLLSKFPIVRIPNGLDTEVFHPEVKKKVRSELGLDPEMRYLVFGANFATQDKNKGFEDFVSAVKALESRNIQFEVLVFGSDEPSGSLPYKSRSHFFGFVKEEKALGKIFSAGDCFVLPSGQDNLPNTVMESLACGTPCVAYDVGGVSDLIDDGKNGLLAEPGNPQSLAEGIEKIMRMNNDEFSALTKNSREKVLAEFDQKTQAQSVCAFYNSILSCV